MPHQLVLRSMLARCTPFLSQLPVSAPRLVGSPEPAQLSTLATFSEGWLRALRNCLLWATGDDGSDLRPDDVDRRHATLLATVYYVVGVFDPAV